MRPDVSVYGILDPARSLGRPLDALADAAARGGVTLFQLRDKTGTTRQQIERARAVLRVTQRHGVPLLINDRVDVALASGADGVHVGQTDMSPRDARALLGEKAIVGLTIHSVEEAQSPETGLADYFGVGGIFATSSKNNPDPPIGVDGFDRIRVVLGRHAPGRPVVGIAGITHENAASVMEAGADGVAVISDIFMEEDVEGAARRLALKVRDAVNREVRT